MKFGVREIVDVVFKAAADNQRIGDRIFKKYQPVFKIDTAQTSSLEQSTTTVYAQGGKGYARLIAWEGEKQMTFTVTDALMSPMGLAVLTGAGLIKPNGTNKIAHVHMTIDKALNASGQAVVTLEDLQEETGLNNVTRFTVCALEDLQPFATRLDGSGAGIEWYSNVTVDGTKEGTEFITVDATHSATFTVKDNAATPALVTTGTVQLDFYLAMNNANAVTEVDIAPENFGGYFYIEAQTLYRREDTGLDMAAEIIIPKAKVQSNFTFTMAASGDPSTFDFVMDAFPGYTRFDRTKKLMCKIQILGSDNDAEEVGGSHTHDTYPIPESPTFDSTGFDTGVTVVPSSATGLTADEKANQAKTNVSMVSRGNKDTINVTITGGIESLNDVEPEAGWGSAKWVALDYNTGEDTIIGITYRNRGVDTVLGTDDVDDADALGLPAGHLVVWVKADLASVEPATFSLIKDGKQVDVTINAA